MAAFGRSGSACGGCVADSSAVTMPLAENMSIMQSAVFEAFRAIDILEDKP